MNLATVVSYSEAIDNFDQGLTEEAVRTLEKTVKDNPGFIMAVDKLQQVRKNLIVLDKQREEQLAQKIEVILNNMNLDSVNWAIQISNSWSILISTFSYEALLEFNTKLLEKGISPEKRMYGASMDIQFGEMMEMYNITAYSQLKLHEEVINHGQTYLARYPVSMYYTSVRMNVEQSLAELEAREAGAKKIDKVLQYDAFLAYVSYLDKFEIYKENLSSAEMKNFTDLMQNQVIKYLEKTKVLTEDFDAYDLKDLFDACLKLEKPELASDLIKTAHSILDGTEDEEKVYSMEEELNDYNEGKKEKTDKLAEYKERYAKAIPEEIPPLLLHGHDIIDCGGFDLIVEISKKYFRDADTRDTDNVVRSRHQAWFNLLSKAEKTNDIKEYEEVLSRYKQDKFIQSQNFEWYSNELKSYEEDLRDLQAGRRAYTRDFTAYSPEKDMINRYAGSCSEYDQYVSAIKFRKQLMQNFKLTDEEKSMNYYFMVLAYNNLGKFDEARIFAKMLMNEIPESDYASAVKSLIDFMPR